MPQDMLQNGIILLLLSICVTSSYKFLVYSPIFGYSHMNFMGAIADTLTEAGHNVLLKSFSIGRQFREKNEIITQPIICFGNATQSISIFYHNTTMSPTKSFVQTIVTEPFLAVISDDELMKKLEQEKFDVGISEAFSVCGLGKQTNITSSIFSAITILGIFERIKVPATIATTSGVYFDVVSSAIGEPIVPSYVPGRQSHIYQRRNAD
ncbi:unnamed protein product [Nippostrongylus brasiliensis]|uniref:glucuronosyltransferase n=1 Tax=Nippostrongylus brasiliensis TaxID=27835 RepID=A0A0N4Y161_NIPBR|nr:unnamed protein product [Nippostrongylus brasiliensis]